MVEIDITYLPHVINNVINDYVGSSEIVIKSKIPNGELKLPLIFAVFWVKGGAHHIDIRNVKFFSDPERALFYAIDNPINECYTYIIPIIGSSIALDCDACSTCGARSTSDIHWNILDHDHDTLYECIEYLRNKRIISENNNKNE